MSELIYFVKNGFNRGVKDAITLKPVREALRSTLTVTSKRDGSVNTRRGKNVQEPVHGKATVKKAG